MQQEEELDFSKNERQGRSLYSLRRRTQVLIRNCSACLRAKQGSRKVEGGIFFFHIIIRAASKPRDSESGSSQNPHERLGVVANACNPRNSEMPGGDKQIPASYGLANLTTW